MSDAEQIQDPKLKQRVAKFAIGMACLYILIKGWGALVSGSAGVLAMAVEGCMDLVSAVVTYFAIRFADEPPDEEHPYGHGKFEQAAAIFQATIMLGLSAFLIVESIERWLAAEPVARPGLGILAMAITGSIGFIFGPYLKRRAVATGSPSLAAYARMIFADATTDAAVLITLGLYIATGWLIWDVGIAAAVGVYIAWEAFQSLREAWYDLTDRAVDPEVEQRIHEIADRFEHIHDVHDIRTRRSGPYTLLDLHMRACRNQRLLETSFLARRLADAIEAEIPRSNVLIKTDPCDVCEGATCETWQKSPESVRERSRLFDLMRECDFDVQAAAREEGVTPAELADRLEQCELWEFLFPETAPPAGRVSEK